MNNTLIRSVTTILKFIGILTIIIFLWEWLLQPRLISDNNSTNTQSITIDSSPSIPLEQRFSSGDIPLFTNKIIQNNDQGFIYFKIGNYEKAYQQFTQAVSITPRDPEIQIYRNNSQARKAGKPFILAAVVPVDKRPTNAEEMLRGVAQGQTKLLLLMIVMILNLLQKLQRKLFVIRIF